MQEDGTFGIDLEILTERYGIMSDLGYGPRKIAIPMFLEALVQRLLELDLTIEGIFRRNGQVRSIKALSEKIDARPNDVTELFQEECNPIHLAAILKKFLRELPEPLLTRRLGDLFLVSQSKQNTGTSR